MAFNKPIDGNDCVNYKIANTDKQSCLVCGHPMTEKKIGLSITNAHLKETKAKKMKSTNLWVHHECMAKFSKELRIEKHEENQRINFKKNTSKKQWCIYCGKKITKAIHIEMNNRNDAITTKKTLWMCRKCGPKLGIDLHWKRRNLPN